MGVNFSSHVEEEALQQPIQHSLVKRGSPEAALLHQQMADYGFAVLSLGEEEGLHIDNMFEVGKQFFALDKEGKEIHSDPKGENMGYMNVEGVREHIKLRVDGDRRGAWPEGIPDYKRTYEATSNLLGSIAWNVFLELSQFAKYHPKPHYKELTDEVLKDLKECVTERSAIAVIHYYAPDTSPAKNNDAVSCKLVDVCDEHTDTGILTLILCSQVAGLQIWNKKTGKWVEVEKTLIEKYKSQSPNHLVMCIMGEKAGLFTGSTVLGATLHRVMIKSTTERYSMLYFMDTAK